MAEARESFLDRTIRKVRSAWHDVAGRESATLGETVGPMLSTGDITRFRSAIADCLDAHGGQVSALARAAELGEAYLGLDQDGRRQFLELLAHEFGAARGPVDDAARAVIAAHDEASRVAAEQALRGALVPERLALFQHFGALPDGVKFLVDMRAELRSLEVDPVARKILDPDLKDLLASWFGVGFLDLRRITWDSSAELLERLIAYEAVHHIQSWSDLKNRLDSDRRCFAFFHPRMPGEPLIFVEVALVNGLADNVQDLLDESAPRMDPTAADTAIFYSISNAQRGLSGISLGNFLIKRVVDLLRQEFPNLSSFSTLSPMPGFRRWLNAQMDSDSESVSNIVGPDLAKTLGAQLDGDWSADQNLVRSLRSPLLKLGAAYIMNGGGKGRVIDPVGHFHLTNGARFERLNFLADRSDKGLKQAAGMMINYLYKLDEIDANHEAYSDDGTVATGSQVRGLMSA